MDHVDRDWSRAAFAALQSRIHLLSERLARRYRLALPSESLTRKLKAACLFVVAAILGILAHRLNDEEAESRWRHAHVPSARIWIASFRTEGFQRLENPSALSRVMRTLPSTVDSTGKVWNADPDWWAIESPEANQPLIFCLRCNFKNLPKTWKSLGNGWEAWESATQEAQRQAQMATQAAHSGPKRKEFIDPREIRY